MIHNPLLASHAAFNQMGAVIFYAYTFSLLRQTEEGRGFAYSPIQSHSCTAANHAHGGLACYSTGVHSPNNAVSVDGNAEKSPTVFPMPCVFTRVITV